MIIKKITIKSFCVLKRTISINIAACDHRKEVIEELNKIKGKKWRYTIEACTDQGETLKLDINAKIPTSISLDNTINFTLHTDIQRVIIYRLLEIKISKKVVLKFISHKENTLQDLTTQVAKKLNITEEEALRQATSFKSTKSPGNTVSGKTSIFNLSERHKTVAASKLQQMLRSPIKHKSI